ncbi:MAG: tetratricopeptide repeat-containing glycosyltransferase family protein [Phenylobacterium sp.]
MSFADAVAQAQAGRFDDACATLEGLLAANPGDATAWAMLGSLRLELGRLDAAIESYDRALALRPNHAASEVNRANALKQLGRPAEALAGYDRAIALEPDLAPAHNNRARALIDLERYDEAATSARAALALQPAYANAWMNLGTALYRQGEFASALEAYERAEQLGGDRYEAQFNLGTTLASLGRFDAAARRFEAALAIDPAAATAHHSLSLIRLAQGDFARGWAGYAHRWGVTHTSGRTWGFAEGLRDHLAISPTAADLAGRNVAVLAEQGVGDQIMFASLLPDLEAAAAQVTLVCDQRLAGLFAASFPGIEVVGADHSGSLRVSQFDIALPMGSLAGAYRNREDQFPRSAYLKPAADVAQAWRARLGPKSRRLRVGVSWRGGAPTTRATARSMPLSMLRPLLTRDDCEFVSLQYGEARAEVEAANADLPSPIRLFDKAEIDDFEQLAGLLCGLDLVVSVQTSIIHLSGALGTPCFTMIPQTPEWRYMIARDDMPWYGSVRLFRQTDEAGWPPVIDRIVAAVAEFHPHAT